MWYHNRQLFRVVKHDHQVFHTCGSKFCYAVDLQNGETRPFELIPNSSINMESFILDYALLDNRDTKE